VDWSEAIKEYIDLLKPVTINEAVRRKVLSLIDLTSLNATDTEASIASLCEKAQSSRGHVAAVCVYPRFARLVADNFRDTEIKTATVVNFPEGTDALESVLIDISDALLAGAQEIDVVFPYPRYLAGERQYAHSFVASCKAACGDDAVLKVILETGALSDPAIIADACYESFISGADFVKTSTGKIAEGATLEAAATMLLVIRHVHPQLKRRMGLKVSGGIKDMQQAAQYLELAEQIMGPDWVSPAVFRIGASKLVDELLTSV
jgi:deoxyribose-phosphate aldolase